MVRLGGGDGHSTLLVDVARGHVHDILRPKVAGEPRRPLWPEDGGAAQVHPLEGAPVEVVGMEVGGDDQVDGRQVLELDARALVAGQSPQLHAEPGVGEDGEPLEPQQERRGPDEGDVHHGPGKGGKRFITHPSAGHAAQPRAVRPPRP